MKRLIIAFAALVSIAASAPVEASVINWTLVGVTFDDGATASGTFSTDSSTGDITAYDITTTMGSSLPSTLYDTSSAPFVVNNPLEPNSFSLLSLAGPSIVLTFVNALTSPGTDLIVIGNYLGPTTAHSYECIHCFPIRLVSAGDAVGVAAGAPEPSTWAMMLVGFATLGYAGYRFSRKPAAPSQAKACA